VITDNYQPTLIGEAIGGLLQCYDQVLQFPIDGDPQCQKSPGGWMDLTPWTGDGVFYYASQLEGAVYRAVPDNVSGYLSAVTLFAINSDELPQFVFRESINNISRSQLLTVAKAHIQRAIMLKAKAALSSVKLNRGNAEVEENPVDGHEVVLRADCLYVGEVVID